MTIDEMVDIARAGAAHGCTEALFTLGVLDVIACAYLILQYDSPSLTQKLMSLFKMSPAQCSN